MVYDLNLYFWGGLIPNESQRSLFQKDLPCGCHIRRILLPKIQILDEKREARLVYDAMQLSNIYQHYNKKDHLRL